MRDKYDELSNAVTDVKKISIQDYTYELPQERIATYPLEKRDASSMLVYRQGTIDKAVFSDISSFLPPGGLMVFNNTRVVQARLLFRKPTGALIEVFCLEPAGEQKDIQLAFQQKQHSSWFCLVGNAKKWKEGTLEMQTLQGAVLQATRGEARQEGYVVHFQWNNPELSFAEILEMAGKTPLPPYLNRKAEEEDKTRYQTVYARHSGSVAAPTAGLHFSDEVLHNLAQQQIETAYVTLHVGAGTFKPVSASTMDEHQMHNEQIVVDRTTLKQLIRHCNNQIISVGTTSLRTLESLYWLGVKILRGYELPQHGFAIDQWEPYQYKDQLPDAREALEALVKLLDKHNMDVLHGETSLIIVPGYKVKMAHVLVTNFHQPGSTLLLLVAAFIGSDWRKVYDFALNNHFRFLSYGDSCLLFRPQDIP
ncbi:MAG: S-adenosylmethionine:tRNA ribosyltransferase-isomerase [Bacteroidales bacterium]